MWVAGGWSIIYGCPGRFGSGIPNEVVRKGGAWSEELQVSALVPIPPIPILLCLHSRHFIPPQEDHRSVGPFWPILIFLFRHQKHSNPMMTISSSQWSEAWAHSSRWPPRRSLPGFLADTRYMIPPLESLPRCCETKTLSLKVLDILDISDLFVLLFWSHKSQSFKFYISNSEFISRGEGRKARGINWTRVNVTTNRHLLSHWVLFHLQDESGL